MADNLVIVESPAKAKTIGKFLGGKYKVVASNGHVRDLPKSQLGVDEANDFEPKYITLRGRGDVLERIRKEAKSAKHILLATDPDMEGEAISWHLAHILKLDPDSNCRIVFNEITEKTVKNSVKHPRSIDMKLVDAQQARRVLDRLVGYKISPILWAKVRKGLSAGRVQSVATRIICDREQEINDFVADEYWSVTASLKEKGIRKLIEAKFYGYGDKKTELKNEPEAQSVVDKATGAVFIVTDAKTALKTRHAPAPFTTSSLQQEASRKLGFTAKLTMLVAQQLYEGIELQDRGVTGLITYMRTDSVRVSEEAQALARAIIESRFGAKYVPEKPNIYKGRKGAQDAHEAVRPANVALTPAEVKDSLTPHQFKLYKLIYERFIASQMSEMQYETNTVTFDANGCTFKASGQRTVFDGYTAVYIEGRDEAQEKDVALPEINKGDKLEATKIEKEQHFTQPPAHYTEASLVKTLEELGIGRPSTYAPTITTIIARHYIAKENKNLYVTELGEAVNDIMKKAFPTIVDVNFTANMEALLDGVAEGEVKWKEVIRNFYPDLEEAVKAAEKELENVKIEDEVSDVVCELCGRNMVIKYGPHGKFLGCPGFPECRNTKPYYEKIGVACPKCGKEIVLKKTKKGRRYFGCENNPDCDFMSWQKPVARKCPQCGGYMVEKGSKTVCADENCGYIE